VQCIRVKEFEAWSPKFIEEIEDNISSDEESVGDDKEQKSGNKVNVFELD
ncbi:hypothetical protein Tco_0444100, partial [Tanacetum coccineum]